MIEKISDNAYEITHRGHTYAIIRRSSLIDSYCAAMYDLYIDGHGPREFNTLSGIARKYPHLGYDLSMI